VIRPSIVVPASNQTTMFTPPLGLAYVAGTLRAGGFEVQVVDGVGESLDTRHPAAKDCFMYGLTHDQIVERIDADTRVIGVAFGFSFEWPPTRALVQAIRARFPGALLIGGGEHVTAVPRQSLADSALDVAVLGEGEETALELCRAYRDGTPAFETIKGMAYKRRDGSIVVNARRERLSDVDAIPLPAWDLMPIENYMDRGYGFGVNRGRSMPLLASRGCPYQCTFCSSPAMWTTRWIARDADLVLDEIARYQARYGAQNFDFYDLTAIVKKSWIIDFCRKIEARRMTFTWQLPSGTRSEAIDAEVARWLYRSGCRNLSYSPESGSPGVLKRIKKKINTESVLASIRASYDSGISVKTNIMLGFPGETYREVFETYRFIARMAVAGADDVAVWAFSPYPGSELFAEISRRRSLVLDDDYYDSLRSYADASRTISYSEHFTDRRLKLLRWLGVALFYGASWGFRPLRPFRILWHVWTGKHETRSEMALANILRRRRLKSA